MERFRTITSNFYRYLIHSLSYFYFYFFFFSLFFFFYIFLYIFFVIHLCIFIFFNVYIFCRGADGILLVYDVNNEGSFTNMRLWMQEIHRYNKGEGEEGGRRGRETREGEEGGEREAREGGERKRLTLSISGMHRMRARYLLETRSIWMGKELLKQARPRYMSTTQKIATNSSKKKTKQ